MCKDGSHYDISRGIVICISVFTLIALLCCSFWIVDIISVKASTRGSVTQVVIVGTIHSDHFINERYSLKTLWQIVVLCKPDVILFEDQSSRDNSMNYSNENREDNSFFSYPEKTIIDKITKSLNIKQIPFDLPNRREHFRKTKYFERKQRANILTKKWISRIMQDDPNSIDLVIARLGMVASEYQRNLVEPNDINSEVHDSFAKIKYLVYYEIMPKILQAYDEYKVAASDWLFLKEEWEMRNNVMAHNIKIAAQNFHGKRLVILVGADHRYILRDLLCKDKTIQVWEYWENIPSSSEGEK